MLLITQTHEMFQQLEQSRIYMQVYEYQHCQATYWCTVFKCFSTKPGRCWNHWYVPHLPAFVPYHPMYDTSCLHFLCVFVALLQLWIFFSSTAPLTTARILLPVWSHWCSRGRGKEQGRAARYTGMVGSCRSCKKSLLYGVCISGVEGTARFPHATNCSMIYRPPSLP